MARKTEFELETIIGVDVVDSEGCKISIIGEKPEYWPYVCIDIKGKNYFIKDRDLERFAVNILKALGSKKLASHNNNYRHVPYPNAEGQGVQ